ncbi:MAG: hypothetical protein OSJ22_02650 [Rikenellaceae bacterium]|nr:hypothetical protein [Rikenellaceae bacterium]
MGIRTKIRLGFTSLGLLLILAAVISYFELARLNGITRRIISEGATSVELSNDILDAINREDGNIMIYLRDKDTVSFNRLSRKSLGDLDSVLYSMKSSFPENKLLDTLINRKKAYSETINAFADNSALRDATWYFTVYKHDYNALVDAVKDFMRSTQELVTVEASNIQQSAYRSIMQGIVSVGASLVLILMFYFLIEAYYITPIIRITKGLRNFLLMRVPFKVEITGRDEVFMLKEYIEQLLLRLKAKKSVEDTSMKN